MEITLSIIQHRITGRRAMKDTRKVTILVLLCLWTLFIWANSFDSIEASSVKSDWVADKIGSVLDETLLTNRPNPKIQKYIVRKAAHFFEFFVLAILWMLYMAQGKNRILRNRQFVCGGITLFLCLLTAAADERIQAISPGRTPGWNDVLIDFGGAAFGVCIFGVAHHIMRLRGKIK